MEISIRFRFVPKGQLPYIQAYFRAWPNYGPLSGFNARRYSTRTPFFKCSQPYEGELTIKIPHPAQTLFQSSSINISLYGGQHKNDVLSAITYTEEASGKILLQNLSVGSKFDLQTGWLVPPKETLLSYDFHRKGYLEILSTNFNPKAANWRANIKKSLEIFDVGKEGELQFKFTLEQWQRIERLINSDSGALKSDNEYVNMLHTPVYRTPFFYLPGEATAMWNMECPATQEEYNKLEIIVVRLTKISCRMVGITEEEFIEGCSHPKKNITLFRKCVTVVYSVLGAIPHNVGYSSDSRNVEGQEIQTDQFDNPLEGQQDCEDAAEFMVMFAAQIRVSTRKYVVHDPVCGAMKVFMQDMAIELLILCINGVAVDRQERELGGHGAVLCLSRSTLYVLLDNAKARIEQGQFKGDDPSWYNPVVRDPVNPEYEAITEVFPFEGTSNVNPNVQQLEWVDAEMAHYMMQYKTQENIFYSPKWYHEHNIKDFFIGGKSAFMYLRTLLDSEVVRNTLQSFDEKYYMPKEDRDLPVGIRAYFYSDSSFFGINNEQVYTIDTTKCCLRLVAPMSQYHLGYLQAYMSELCPVDILNDMPEEDLRQGVIPSDIKEAHTSGFPVYANCTYLNATDALKAIGKLVEYIKARYDTSLTYEIQDLAQSKRLAIVIPRNATKKSLSLGMSFTSNDFAVVEACYARLRNPLEIRTGFYGHLPAKNPILKYSNTDEFKQDFASLGLPLDLPPAANCFTFESLKLSSSRYPDVYFGNNTLAMVSGGYTIMLYPPKTTGFEKTEWKIVPKSSIVFRLGKKILPNKEADNSFFSLDINIGDGVGSPIYNEGMSIYKGDVFHLKEELVKAQLARIDEFGLTF